MNVAILGTSISSKNQGVMALGTSLLNLCVQRIDNGEVFLMLGHHKAERVPFRIGDKIREIEVVNCRLSPRAKLKEHLAWILLASLIYRIIPLKSLRNILSRLTPWISALEKADLVGDVRGGDSFSDIYGIKRFILGFLIACTVIMTKKNIVQFPQTFGPYKRPIARVLARFLLKNSSIIIARDKESLKLAQRLVGPIKKVWLCSDVAFSLKEFPPKEVFLEPALDGPVHRGIIGLNVNGLMYHGGYTRANQFGLKLDYRSFLPRLVKMILEKHPGELWLIPHAFSPPGNVESDPEACRILWEELPEELKKRVRILTGEYDCQELKWLIGQCDFFIGSRMHSCIAALSQGVPCVGIAYSRKFEGVFDTVGMADWVIDGRKVENEEAIARVLELYHNRNEIREPLKQRAAQAKKMLEETFDRLIQEILCSHSK